MDTNFIAAGTGDARAHAVKAIRQVDNFRLTGGIFDNGFTIGQGRGHHQVFSRTHTHNIHEDTSAF